MSLTNSERMQSLEMWSSLKRDRFKSIIVHCGAGSIKDTIDLVKHASTVSVLTLVVASKINRSCSIDSLMKHRSAKNVYIVHVPGIMPYLI